MTRARRRRVRVAARWILVVAALYLISGLLTGRSRQALVDAELDRWRPFGADAQIELVDGEVVTFAEHEQRLQGSVRLVYLIGFGLAGATLLLWLWARIAPLPSMITALGIYATVIVLNAVLDPATLTNGVTLKIGILAALLSGVRSALAYRDAAERDSSP